MLLIGTDDRNFTPLNAGRRLKILSKKPDPILDRAFLAFRAGSPALYRFDERRDESAVRV